MKTAIISKNNKALTKNPKTAVAVYRKALMFGKKHADPRGLIMYEMFDHQGKAGDVWRDENDTIYLVQPEENHNFGCWIIDNTDCRNRHYETLKAAKASMRDEYRAYLLCANNQLHAAVNAHNNASAKAVDCETVAIPTYWELLKRGFENKN